MSESVGLRGRGIFTTRIGTAVPRLGGIALAAAFLASAIFAFVLHPHDFGLVKKPLVFVVGVLAMFGLGLWDDFKPLGAKKKLFGQVLIASSMYAFGISIEQFKLPFDWGILHLGAWGYLVTVGWLVGMTNLINLIDGVDGLAGGICLMLMVLLAYVGYHTNQLGLLAAGTAGGLVGFLWFNFPPARIYMGDGGAYMLGFLIGVTTIVSSNKGTVMAALVAPLFVLALPILDTSLAILRRGLQGLPIFRPDRRHIHHRLLSSGLSRRKMVLGAYVFTLVFLMLGFLAFTSGGQMVPALFGVALLVILLCAGQLHFSREWFAVGRVLGHSLDMRQDIQYALCLSRWLEMEAMRAESVEALYEDFLFILRKLGFSYAKLTLGDGTRTWQAAASPNNGRRVEHELQGGHAGILELAAPPCPQDATPNGEFSQDPNDPPCSRTCPCVASDKLFDILSELVAEAWLKAARKWEKTHRIRVHFAARSSVAQPALGTSLRSVRREPAVSK